MGFAACWLHLSLTAKRCTAELDRLTYWSSRKIIKGPSIHLSIQGVFSESYYRAPDRRAHYSFRVSSIYVSIIFRLESCPGFHLLVVPSSVCTLVSIRGQQLTERPLIFSFFCHNNREQVSGQSLFWCIAVVYIIIAVKCWLIVGAVQTLN